MNIMNTMNSMNTINWIDKQVSLYATHSDNTGRPETYRDILLTHFGKDLPAICELRKLDKTASSYKTKKLKIKKTLQCYTPAALLETKEHGKLTEINRTGIMQLDFDYADIHEYDIEDLKQCIFDLPFIGFCGLSCSGDGFYALAVIADPLKLSEYAEHCFEVLKSNGIKADESKGKKPENLRYLSYDANMLIRENPEPLHINDFKTKKQAKKEPAYSFNQYQNNNNNALLNAELKKLNIVQCGERWATVQKSAYTIGGLYNPSFIYDIKNAINSNPAFNGEEDKYLKCAQVCFEAGMKQPLQIK